MSSNLTEQLRSKLKQEQQLIEQAAQEHNEILQKQIQQQLSATRKLLQQQLQKELHTMQSDISKSMSSLPWRTMKNAMLWPAAMSFLICIAFFASAWGVMRYQASVIIEQQQTIQQLTARGGQAVLVQCQDRLCVQIDETAPQFRNGYRVIQGY